MKALDRCTPDLTPPTHPDGVLETPHKVTEFQEVLAIVEAAMSPTTRRGVVKLGRGAIQAVTTATLLTGNVKDIRKHRQDEERAKRSKRFILEEGKRSMNLQEVVRGRAMLDCKKWRAEHHKTGKSLVFSGHYCKPS